MVTNPKSLDVINRIVVLGHTGFVGTRLMDYFSEKHPSLEVTGLSSKDIDLMDASAASNLKDYFDTNTAVIMCAGIKSNFGNDLGIYLANVRMAENVGRVLSSHPVKKFIFFSSIAVYGVDDDNPTITESTPVQLDTYYGLAKYVCEQLLTLTFAELPESSLAVLRTPTIYGPNEKIRAPTPSGFLSTYLAGDEVTIWGDGSELREFLFIEDLARLIDTLTFNDFSGTLNLSSGVARSYEESLAIISNILGVKLTFHSKERTKEKVDKAYDIARLRQIVPEFVFTPLEDGLKFIKDNQQVAIPS